jgi:enoyl-CoA hydratase/carnithine racemase
MSGTVLSEQRDGVRTVTLNRPERLNAINPELLADLKAALAGANNDPDTGCILLRGAGRAFCSGDDLKEFEDQAGTEAETTRYVEDIQDITREIVLGDKMVVGAIHGWAVGGGLEWMINCDLVLVGEGARFFFPEISWGLFVTGAVTALLPRLVGLQKAREMILLGERFGAAEAVEWGLALRALPEADLSDAAHAVARRIADLPQGAVGDLKRTLNKSATLDAEGAMALETQATVRGFLDPETARRIAEFGR